MGWHLNSIALCRQLVEKGLRLLQVHRVKALGEPAGMKKKRTGRAVGPSSETSFTRTSESFPLLSMLTLERPPTFARGKPLRYEAVAGHGCPFGAVLGLTQDDAEIGREIGGAGSRVAVPARASIW
jgi:hypothetical protein